MSNTTVSPRIVGGTIAGSHEFPYQALINYRGRHYCGGTIISPWIILTAAHCVFNKELESFTVVAGEHNISLNEGNEQFRNAYRIIYHEKYDVKTDENDIGLIILTERLIFNHAVWNIALPTNNSVYTDAIATGWGSESTHENTVKVLKKAFMKLISFSECQQKFSQIHQIYPTMLCAGKTGNTCYGDSGGPLSCTSDKDNARVICGITSFGSNCGEYNHPAVFTDVAKYVDWITETLQKFNYPI